MKRFYFIFVCLFALSLCFTFGYNRTASGETFQSDDSTAVSPNIVISQFQVAGGGSNAANDEFIELHNTSASGVDLNGFRLVYRSAGGTNDVLLAQWASTTIVPPGGYYLIASTSYDGGVTPNLTYNPSSCSCSMSASGGGLALRNGAVNTGVIFDSVGYGSATNAFIETAVTNAPPANNGQARINNGCQDTDNNSNDFTTLNPAAPRNASTAPITCGGASGTNLLAGGGANPSTVVPGATTLLTVSVQPATTPPSTGITVTGNLTAIGGAASQPFFDNGTNGDVTAGDNIFSYLATVPTGISGGTYNVSAVAADQQSRTASVLISITVNAPFVGEDPLLLGNPTNATADVNQPTNYLMVKPQYTLSYHRDNGGPNWVAWHLNASWLGDTERQDDFRPDPTLPAGWYRVLPSDYDFATTGMTRGHMTPSGDRTNSVPNNSATFLMTNMLPQIEANNSGAWAKFEDYCRSLATQGQELYIVSGGAGSLGTIAGGRVNVPRYTWKVVLVLPNGTNDLQRIWKGTRTIAIIVPNFQPLATNAPWQQFRVSVNEVENLTGYNFFTNIPKNTQELLEKRKDRQ